MRALPLRARYLFVASCRLECLVISGLTSVCLRSCGMAPCRRIRVRILAFLGIIQASVNCKAPGWTRAKGGTPVFRQTLTFGCAGSRLSNSSSTISRATRTMSRRKADVYVKAALRVGYTRLHRSLHEPWSRLPIRDYIGIMSMWDPY